MVRVYKDQFGRGPEAARAFGPVPTRSSASKRTLAAGERRLVRLGVAAPSCYTSGSTAPMVPPHLKCCSQAKAVA